MSVSVSVSVSLSLSYTLSLSLGLHRIRDSINIVLAMSTETGFNTAPVEMQNRFQRTSASVDFILMGLIRICC